MLPGEIYFPSQKYEERQNLLWTSIDGTIGLNWMVGQSVCQWMSLDDPRTSIDGTIGLDWMVGQSVCQWMSVDDPRTSIRGTIGLDGMVDGWFKDIQGGMDERQ